MNSRIVTWHNH